MPNESDTPQGPLRSGEPSRGREGNGGRGPRGPRSPLRDMQPRARFSLFYYLALFAALFLLQSLLFSGVDAQEIPYSEFRAKVAAGQVAQVVLESDRIYGRLKPPKPEPASPPATTLEVPPARTPWHPRLLWEHIRSAFTGHREAVDAERKLSFTVVRLEDPKLLAALQEHGVEYAGRLESHWLENVFFNWIVPFGAMFLIWGWLMRRMGRGPNALQIGKSQAKIYEMDPATRVRFADLAGVDEAIEETREIVSFLGNPTKFTRLGAKLPKGILLVGPPGTGKTLLARAIAGESGVPFFSLSGSDFVEMFVGVGAARVRDLFQEAKKAAPCIIFIDELDAVGKTRAQPGGLVTGGYDERENTLNQLLVEMDGFDASAGVVLLAATNRPEVLDPALLRPGRFDRRVVLDRPTMAGRAAIFKVHTRKLPLAEAIDLEALAAQTPGMVGSDIANVCNEAALLASRSGRAKIAMEDFQEAVERAIAGPQRKSRVVTPAERERIAYHESGHALVGYLAPGGDPVQKISIIPRSEGALGYTIHMPLEDRYLASREELLGRIRVLLAGRAAEDLVFGDVSTGASDDLERASAIVREMLTVYGMSRKAPNIALADRHGAGFLGSQWQTRRHSEALEQELDAELVEIVGRCYDEARGTLSRERDRLEKLARALLEREELDREEVVALLGPRPEEPPAHRP